MCFELGGCLFEYLTRQIIRHLEYSYKGLKMFVFTDLWQCEMA